MVWDIWQNLVYIGQRGDFILIIMVYFLVNIQLYEYSNKESGSQTKNSQIQIIKLRGKWYLFVRVSFTLTRSGVWNIQGLAHPVWFIMFI